MLTKGKLIIVFLWCCHMLSAQGQFRHHYYEGYAQILSMAQDSDGYLWIRSTSKLGRFDGYTIETYFDSLGNNLFGRLTTDLSGRVYVIDESGNRIHRFNHTTNIFESFEPDLKGSTISSIGFDADSRLWLGTRQAGLFMYDLRSNVSEQFIDTYHGMGTKDSLPDTKLIPKVIYDIKDLGDKLLLGTSAGILHFDKKSKSFTSAISNQGNLELARKPVLKIFMAEDGYWLFVKKALLKTDINFRILQEFIFPPDLEPVGVAMDKSGTFWLCTQAQGLFSYNPKEDKVETYRPNPTDKYSISSNILNCVLIDREQSVWLGTYDQGFEQLRKQDLTFHNFYLPNEAAVGHPQILETQRGTFVLSESKTNGVFMLSIGDDPSTLNFEYSTNMPDLKGIHTNSSLLTLDHWWIGTFGKGLISVGIDHREKMPLKTIEYIQASSALDASIGSNDAGIWAEDKHGNLWISAPQNSLQLIKKDVPYGSVGSVVTFKNDPLDSATISSGNIWGVLPEDDGSVWVLTDFNLDLYKEGRFRTIFTRQEGTAYNLTLIKSRSGLLLIGGSDGLTTIRLMDDGNNEIGKPAELKGYVIYSLEEDQLGRWWCYGENGLFCFDPKNQSVVQFTEQDGLASNEGTANSSTQAPNGLMIFGNKAYTVFNPMLFQPSLSAYKPVISGLKLNNTLINNYSDANISMDFTSGKKSSISINHTHRILTLEFAALEYAAPEKNKYRYQLEGFDPIWVETDFKNRSATYTNLEPGTYIFKVKASNHHGFWSDQEAKMEIIVLPPPWRTWWAYTGYSILFVGLLVWARGNIVQRERLKSNLALAKVEQEREHFELEKAKEVDRVKTSFFTNISHEFRTPLTLIKGPVQGMIDQFMDGQSDVDREKILAQLKLIQRNSDLLLKLINQLLDLGKLESGSLKLEKTEGEVYSFVRAIASSFESLARQKGVDINIDVPNESCAAMFDKDKVETILINLINNAVKFTPSGGSVTVLAEIGSEQSISKSQKLILRIKDTGIGIPEEQQTKIFERFHQVSEAHKEVGTGIGLALVKELVALMEGTISVKSEVGNGSEFVVEIPVDTVTGYQLPVAIGLLDHTAEVSVPVTANRQPATEQNTEENGQTTKPHILVVEDNTDLRHFIIESLGNEFYFLEAENGRQGLEVAIREIPDLIISDVMMPEMDGITMAGKVKSDKQTSHIPLIMLTAKSSEDSKLEGLRTGADDYLTKPFNKQELLLKVRNGVMRQQKLREKLRAELLSTAPKVEVISEDERFLNTVKEKILERLGDEQLSVESLAEDIGMSRVQLYRKVSGLIDISVNELIRKLRLQRAAQLLQQNWGPVTQVAYEVGFSNLSYFSKVFKEEFGALPSEYEYND